MSGEKRKVVIVDDNPTRREQIKGILPEYVNAVSVGYGDDATNAIKRSPAGEIPSLVIINADDSKGLGLFTFDWLKNKEESLAGEFVPVILITEDQYSDRALDFYEIADAIFYDGPLTEDDFFPTFVEAIQSEAIDYEEEEPVYEETKSVERLMGKSVKAAGGSQNQPMRSAILSLDEDRISNLEAALERGRQRAEDIRTVLNGALDVKEKKAMLNRISVTDKMRKEKGFVKKEQPPKAETIIIKSDAEFDDTDIPDEFKVTADQKAAFLSKPNKSLMFQISEFGKQFIDAGASNKNVSAEDFYKNFNARQKALQQERNVVKAPDGNAYFKIVVVDNDPMVIKACELYLGSKYKVIGFKSGMDAVDYFVNDTAQLLILDTVLPIVSGQQLLNSIRWSKGGANVPVIFLIGSDFTGRREDLAGNLVLGTLPKPLASGSLLAAVEQVMMYYRSRTPHK